MFGTSGIRGPLGETVTADLALDVGRAVATDGASRVLVGRDARESGRFLADAVAAGLAECGADVVDLGQVATPTLARSIERLGADAGVVITASHNPAPDNGLKLWTPSGQAFDTDRRQRITELIDESAYEFAPWDATGSRRHDSTAEAAHTSALIATVDREPIEGLNVVVDVGNGVGGLTASTLGALGAEVTTLNAQPDGAFPGRPSEPTAETLTDLCAQVANTAADIGIAHDGDADRMLAVDETGTFVPKDVLFALFARRAVEKSGGGRVAAPVDTSLAVDDAVAEAGGEMVRTKVGDVYVAEAAAKPGAFSVASRAGHGSGRMKRCVQTVPWQPVGLPRLSAAVARCLSRSTASRATRCIGKTSTLTGKQPSSTASQRRSTPSSTALRRLTAFGSKPTTAGF